MRKTIRLPAPQLSQLKEVNIDLDMTGRHYALLAESEGQLPEDVALSILKDLIEEDANKLTLTELRYLFILVKINNLENDYTVTLTCQHTNKKGKVCGCINKMQVFLSDADLNDTPSDYVPPKILFRSGNKETGFTEKEYSVIPPTMNWESALYNFFQTEYNATQEQIIEDKKLAFNYTFLRGLLHLIDSDGHRLVKDTDNFKDLLSYLDVNKFTIINHLYELVNEVGKYGVQNKVYEIKCKECGGSIIFQLPLLNGLVD
jgi:hypothetical protein